MKNHRRKTHQAEIKKEEIAERSKSQQKSLASKRSKMSPKKPRVSPLNVMSPTKLNYSPTKQNQNNISESSKFQNRLNRPVQTTQSCGPVILAQVLNSILVHCQACEHLNPNCPNCVTIYHQKYWEWAMLLHHQRLLHARKPQHGPHQMIPTVPEHTQTRGKIKILC